MYISSIQQLNENSIEFFLSTWTRSSSKVSLSKFLYLCSLTCSPFQCLQFFFSLVQYSLLYLLSNYPNNFLAINLSGSSPLLKVSSFFSCLLTFSMSLLYSFLNSSTASFAFSRFYFPFQVSDSVVNSFHCTKYLSFPLIYCLFNIFSTFYSSSSSIITRAGCFFLCSSTCPIYLYILLTFTTRCIFIVLGNFSSTVFDNIIFFTL